MTETPVGFGCILFGCLYYERSYHRAFWLTIFHPLHQAQSDVQGEHVFLRTPKGFNSLASTHCLTLNRYIYRLCQLLWAFIMRVCEIWEQQDNSCLASLIIREHH